jgi:hypothetical protein
MQKPVDPLLAILVRCKFPHEIGDSRFKEVHRGIRGNFNWELTVRLKSPMTNEQLDCVKANLPHGADVELIQ